MFITGKTPPASGSASSGKGVAGLLSGVGTILSGPVGGLLGSLAGAIFSARGARKRNKEQIQMAREQMAFQERMSSTAYQRAAKDLEAAGLNRILALGKPASSPGGAMPQIMDEAAPAAATALSLKRLQQEIRNMQATERLTDRQAVSETARAHYIQSQDANIQAGTQQTIESTRNTVLQRIGITETNEKLKFDKEIRRAQVPGVEAEEAFWEMLMSVESEQAAIALGKWGPMALNAIRAYFASQRARR